MAAAGRPHLSFNWTDLAGVERTITIRLLGTVLQLKQEIEAVTEYKVGFINVGIVNPDNASVPILLTDNASLVLDYLPIQLSEDAITIPNHMNLIVFNQSSSNPLYDIVEVLLPGGVQEKVPLFKLPLWTRDYTVAKLQGMQNMIILREPSESALASEPNTKCVVSYTRANGSTSHATLKDFNLTDFVGYTIFKGDDTHRVNAANLQGGRRTRRRHRSRRHRSRRY